MYIQSLFKGFFIIHVLIKSVLNRTEIPSRFRNEKKILKSKSFNTNDFLMLRIIWLQTLLAKISFDKKINKNNPEGKFSGVKANITGSLGGITDWRSKRLIKSLSQIDGYIYSTT